MNLNLCKEQFSRAYVRAIAAVAGLKVSEDNVDDDSIDISLGRSGGASPKIDLQLKCTAERIPPAGVDLTFALGMKNYDDLRRRTMTPRWLVVLFVSERIQDWLQHLEDPHRIQLLHCAWWLNLQGYPDSQNTSSQTVRIPRENFLNAQTLNLQLDEIERTFTATE